MTSSFGEGLPSLPGLPTRMVAKYNMAAGSSPEDCTVAVLSVLINEHRLSSPDDVDVQALFMLGHFYAQRPPENEKIVILSLPTVLLYDLMIWLLKVVEDER